MEYWSTLNRTDINIINVTTSRCIGSLMETLMVFHSFFESVTFLFFPLEYPTERQAWMELEREEVGEAEDF